MAKMMNTATVMKVVLDGDEDKGTPNETTWHIGALDGHVVRHLYSMISENYSGVEASLYQVGFGLKGWDNLKDSEGNDIPFQTVVRTVGKQTYQVVTDELLGRIPPVLVGELAEKIISINSLTREEAKN